MTCLHAQMASKHGWQKIKSNSTTTKQKLFFPSFLHRSPLPFPSLTQLLLVVTTSLSLIPLGTFDSFLTQNCPWRNMSWRSVKLLISSSKVLVQSANFSLKMQPKPLLPPTSSRGLKLSPHGLTQFCHLTSPESSKHCCMTHSHGTSSSPLYTSPEKAALASHFRAH